LSLTAGVASWTPDQFDEGTTSLGATAAFRVIGGSLLPVAVNLLGGVGTSGEMVAGASTIPQSTTWLAGAGASVSLPTPGVSIEPYVSLTNRWHTQSAGDTDSNLGWTLGANLGFGMFGLHAAYDWEQLDGATAGVFGIGAHFQLRAPAGM
jgi:hypothetical protein